MQPDASPGGEGEGADDSSEHHERSLPMEKANGLESKHVEDGGGGNHQALIIPWLRGAGKETSARVESIVSRGESSARLGPQSYQDTNHVACCSDRKSGRVVGTGAVHAE